MRMTQFYENVEHDDGLAILVGGLSTLFRPTIVFKEICSRNINEQRVEYFNGVAIEINPITWLLVDNLLVSFSGHSCAHSLVCLW